MTDKSEQTALDVALDALHDIRVAIFNADPNVLTDTLWMPDELCMGGTVVDFIDATTDRVRAMDAAEEASPSPTPSAGVDAVAEHAQAAWDAISDGPNKWCCLSLDERDTYVEFATALAALTPAPMPVEPRCTICNGTGVTDQSFGMGTSPGECPVCSRANPTPVEAGGEVVARVIREMRDCILGLKVASTLTIAEWRHLLASVPALAKPSPAGGAVREAVVADAVIDHTAAEIAGLVGPNDEARAVEEAVKRALVFMRSVFTARLSSPATTEPALAGGVRERGNG